VDPDLKFYRDLAGRRGDKLLTASLKIERLQQALGDLIEAFENSRIELGFMEPPTPLIELLNTEAELAIVERARTLI
jgi:hypothetical protein